MKNGTRRILMLLLSLTLMFGSLGTAFAEPVSQEGFETILLVGLDQYERTAEEEGQKNSLAADFLLLLVLDHERQTFQILHINRDSVVSIEQIDKSGNVTGRMEGYIAQAHTYGDGGHESCKNTVRAVSRLLGGITVDHYVSTTMDSVALVNDLVGGVEVTIKDDFSYYDPQMVPGVTMTLKGEQALTYIRERIHVGSQTNLSRMERQREYLNLLYDKVKSGASLDAGLILKLGFQLAKNVKSDMSVLDMTALGLRLMDYHMGELLTLRGQNVREAHMLYYVDPSSIHEALNTLYPSKSN